MDGQKLPCALISFPNSNFTEREIERERDKIVGRKPAMQLCALGWTVGKLLQFGEYMEKTEVYWLRLERVERRHLSMTGLTTSCMSRTRRAIDSTWEI